MIWLAVAALLISTATVWYLARPLAQTALANDSHRAHQLQLVRGRLLTQLNELDLEEADKNIDTSVLVDERTRLETELAQVLRELKSLTSKRNKKKQAGESRRAWVIALVAFGVLLPLSAAGLYSWSQRAILAQLSNPQAPTNATMPPMVMEMVARLEKRLAEQPDDAAGWHRLARAYAVLGRAEAANAAYVRSYKLTPDDPEVVAEYAGFLYQGDPQNTGGQVFELFSHLNKLDPGNRDALWFLGFAAYQKSDYQQALGYWDHLLKLLPPESPEAEHMRAITSKTRQKLGKK